MTHWTKKTHGEIRSLYLSLVYAMVGPIRANKNLIVYNISGCKQALIEPKVLSTLFDIEYIQFLVQFLVYGCPIHTSRQNQSENSLHCIIILIVGPFILLLIHLACYLQSNIKYQIKIVINIAAISVQNIK